MECSIFKQNNMARFDVPRDLPGLAAKLPEFLRLAGEKAWWKRVDQLDRDARQSQFQTKIVLDHHWLEMELAAQIDGRGVKYW
jgi:hypothetical protein